MQKKRDNVSGTIRIIIASFLVIAGFSACRHKEPNVIYMPDMVYSPALKAQKEGSMRPPVKGTIPRNYVPYPYANDPEKAGRELKNPLIPTRDVLARGKHLYETNCFVCHGVKGEGDGPVAPKFGRPPSLQSDKVRTWADGRIYHVITMGQNLMPTYASQVAPEERWMLIHYIRAMQRSLHPTPEDVKISEQE